MDPASILTAIVDWYAARPTHTRVLLALATSVFVIELAFRRFARKSAAYKKWTHVFETIGVFWTAIILAIVYFFSVSLVALFMKLSGKDPLDRSLAAAPTFWRVHEPNPLGPLAAVRHQF